MPDLMPDSPPAAVPPPPDETLVRCAGLVVGHARHALLPPIDLEIKRGTFLVVVGRNGSGKTTWMRTLLGIVPPVDGRVTRARRDLRVAYGAQTMGLDRNLPVRAREVVAWGRLAGRGSLWPRRTQADEEACRRALRDARAEDLAARPFRDLSEGQKQRVLLARVLACEPDLALLDEPTSSMDMIAERETLALLCRLTRERGMAIVVVTHVIGAAAEHANVVAFLDRDDGIVVAGPPESVFANDAFRRHFGVVAPKHVD